MQRTLTFLIFFFLIFLVRMAMVGSSTARRSRVRRQNMKVKINATGDTIVMKFVLPNSDTKLEGFILGYGSSMFSKQFLPLPEDGLPLQTEIDAEPKYLIAVHPVPVNHVRKRCTGKVNLEKPLHLVIGSVTPTTVLLSWGTILKTPYEENIMDNCLEDGHYTIRYRERNRKWNYQTCPTSDTVIDHLKPNTPYEFGVRSNNKERNGMWSPPVIHSTITDEKSPRKTQNPQPPLPPKKTVHQPLFPLHHAVHNRNESKPLHRTPGAPRTIFAPTSATRQRFLSTPRPTMPLVQQETNGRPDQIRSESSTSVDVPLASSTVPHASSTVPRASSTVTHASTIVPHASSTVTHASSTAPRASSIVPHASTIIPYASTTVLHASSTVPRASTTVPHPSTTVPHASSTEAHPSTTVPHPSTTVPHASTTLPHPSSTIPHPSSTVPQPSSTVPHASSTGLHASFAVPHPSTTAPHALSTVPRVSDTIPHASFTILRSSSTPPHASTTIPRASSTVPHASSTASGASSIILHASSPVPHASSNVYLPSSTALPASSTTLHASFPVPSASSTFHYASSTKTQISSTAPHDLSTTLYAILTIPSALSTVPHASSTITHASSTSPHASSQRLPSPTLPHASSQRPPSPTLPHASSQHPPSPTLPHASSQRPPSPTLPHASSQRPPSPTLPHASSQHPSSPTLPHASSQRPPSPTLSHASSQRPSSPTLPHASSQRPSSPTLPHASSQRPPSPTLSHASSQRPSSPTLPHASSQRPSSPTLPHASSQRPSSPTLPHASSQRPSSPTLPHASSQRPSSPTLPHASSQRPPSPTLPHASSQRPSSPTLLHASSQHPPSHDLALVYTATPVMNGQKHRGETQARHNQGNPQKPDHQATHPQPDMVIQNQQIPTAPSKYQVGQPLTSRPALATQRANNNSQDTSFQRPLTSTNPHAPIGSTMPARNTKSPRGRVSSHTTPNGIKPVSPPRKPITNSFLNPGKKGAPKAEKEHQKPDVLSSKHGSSAVPRPSTPFNKMPNLVGKQVEKEEPMNLKGDTASILKPFPPVTAKPAKQKTMTLLPAMNASADNSSVFSALPASEVDALGKKRFVAPHVVYRVNKAPDEPCSITNSLSYFPEEEWVEQNVTAPPRLPPSNVTVVTVEGCSSFVILDWEKADNETTEYEVISRTKGPLGEEVSILTTNQTHTAVENLNPESSYEFEVKSKNELGESPASDPVSFSTESADPRVSETVSGKAAIWTQFPFNADSYSECNGKQYVKRTWYRKFVGIQLCNSLRYKIYMSDSLTGKFYNIGDQTGHGEDHCQFVDSFLDGRTGSQLLADQLPGRLGFYRAVRQEPVHFGEIGANSHATYVAWYECGTPIPGKW
uniref:Fibronectin type-III domain-containing protein n=1 Tax=Esox lucius TaxID=8010 RepID=A0A3P8YV62_ESOLU